MIAKNVFYEGRVQGVGFRYSVKRIAKGYDIVGWVKNMADGRVEVLAGGQASEVTAFLEEIEESELASFIKNKQEHAVSAVALVGLRGFEIRA